MLLGSMLRCILNYYRKKNLLFGKIKFTGPYVRKNVCLKKYAFLDGHPGWIQTQVCWFGCPNYEPNLMINR